MGDGSEAHMSFTFMMKQFAAASKQLGGHCQQSPWKGKVRDRMQPLKCMVTECHQ